MNFLNLDMNDNYCTQNVTEKVLLFSDTNDNSINMLYILNKRVLLPTAPIYLLDFKINKKLCNRAQSSRSI